MIIGVHGIAQQQRGRSQLLEEWRPALSDGLERAIGHPPAWVAFDVAYFGHLFLPNEGDGSKGAENALLVGLDEEETEELAGAASEILPPRWIEQAGATGEMPVKGTWAPGPLVPLLAALDRRFGAAAGVLYLGELRQVRRYLTDPALKANVDGIVDAAMAVGARTLIGHSLGSVVAYEFTRRHPEHELDLLVTLGSPLGLRMVRSRLPDGGNSVAAHVRRWVNVRDVNDVVTAGGDLAPHWSGVDDRHVKNGNRPHVVTAYLGKRGTGMVIAESNPEVARQ